MPFEVATQIVRHHALIYEIEEVHVCTRAVLYVRAIKDTAFAAVLNNAARASHCEFCFVPCSDDEQHCSAICTNNAFAAHDRILDECNLDLLDGTKRYPRLIARMVASSLLTGPKFNDFWARVLVLASPTTHVHTHLEEEFQTFQQAFDPAIGAEATQKIFSGPF